MKTLFIGGSHDSEWHDVNPLQDYITLAEQQDTRDTPYKHGDKACDAVMMHEVYKRERYYEGNTLYSVYLIDNNSDRGIIWHLINGYRKPRS